MSFPDHFWLFKASDLRSLLDRHEGPPPPEAFEGASQRRQVLFASKWPMATTHASARDARDGCQRFPRDARDALDTRDVRDGPCPGFFRFLRDGARAKNVVGFSQHF